MNVEGWCGSEQNQETCAGPFCFLLFNRKGGNIFLVKLMQKIEGNHRSKGEQVQCEREREQRLKVTTQV